MNKFLANGIIMCALIPVSLSSMTHSTSSDGMDTARSNQSSFGDSLHLVRQNWFNFYLAGHYGDISPQTALYRAAEQLIKTDDLDITMRGVMKIADDLVATRVEVTHKLLREESAQERCSKEIAEIERSHETLQAKLAAAQRKNDALAIEASTLSTQEREVTGDLDRDKRIDSPSEIIESVQVRKETIVAERGFNSTERKDLMEKNRDLQKKLERLQAALRALLVTKSEHESAIGQLIADKARGEELIVRLAMKGGALIDPSLVVDAFNAHHEALNRYPENRELLQSSADSFKGYDPKNGPYKSAGDHALCALL